MKLSSQQTLASARGDIFAGKCVAFGWLPSRHIGIASRALQLAAAGQEELARAEDKLPGVIIQSVFEQPACVDQL